MKKLILNAIIIMIFSFTFGQETEVLKSKSGQVILPGKGDFSFSIDASPFLNMFNSKGDSPGFNFPDYLPAIYLKYMISDKGALMLAPIIISTSTDYSINASNTPGYYKGTQYSEFGGRFGYERRSGKSRLQIPYGIEGGFSFINDYFYDDDYPDESTDMMGPKIFANIFLGAEYFFAPKISLSGRFSYGVEFVNLHEDDWEGAGLDTRTVNLDYGNFGGALLLSFYF